MISSETTNVIPFNSIISYHEDANLSHFRFRHNQPNQGSFQDCQLFTRTQPNVRFVSYSKSSFIRRNSFRFRFILRSLQSTEPSLKSNTEHPDLNKERNLSQAESQVRFRFISYFSPSINTRIQDRGSFHELLTRISPLSFQVLTNDPKFISRSFWAQAFIPSPEFWTPRISPKANQSQICFNFDDYTPKRRTVNEHSQVRHS